MLSILLSDKGKNLLVDESVDKLNRLREDGHTVAYIAELAPSINDDAVLH